MNGENTVVRLKRRWDVRAEESVHSEMEKQTGKKVKGDNNENKLIVLET